MAYRMVYLRVRCNGYDHIASGGTDLTAFKAESRRLFQEMGWTVHEGRGGVCDTVTKDRQDLYLHPSSFSGVLEEANIPLLREQLSGAQSRFGGSRCRAHRPSNATRLTAMRNIWI